MAPTVTITTGDKACELLRDSDFERQWAYLLAVCPWATPYQSRDFVCTWLTHYRLGYEPIVVTATGPDRALRGLLLLGRQHAGKRLVVAGAHQAEYQCWLSLPDEHVGTLEAMVAALTREFPGTDIHFKYLPSAFPVAELLRSPLISGRAEVRSHRRPLMRLLRAEVEESFQKKSNRSRFNRLSRIGEVTFRRIRDAEQFAQCFDDVATYYDFRQGAANASLPFATDPQKRPFHLDLLRNNPDLLHVTVMWLAGKPLAAHLGIVGKREVHLAILGHSPFLARHSPGKLHLMMLSRQLIEEGLDCLDLTPGGLWKERFANDHDEVWELMLHSSQTTKRRSQAQSLAIAGSRSLAATFGLQPAAARRLLKSLGRLRLASVSRKLQRTLYEKVEFRVYRHTVTSAATRVDPVPVRCDDLCDLLKFRPAERWHETQAFLSAALQRIERGEHVYTLADDHKLLHYGWLIDDQTHACFIEVQQGFEFPEHSAVLYDFYTDPDERGRGLYQRTIQRIIQDALQRIEGLRYVYISVLADNRPSRHVIEKLGFDYQCSLFLNRRFGRVTLTRSDGPVLKCPQQVGRNDE